MLDIKQTMQDALAYCEGTYNRALPEIQDALHQAIKELDDQEPVGEVIEYESYNGVSECFGVVDSQLVYIGDKLYTHPSPLKELSDRDILKCNIDVMNLCDYISAPNEDLINFARAILKAGSE